MTEQVCGAEPGTVCRRRPPLGNSPRLVSHARYRAGAREELKTDDSDP